MWPHEAHDVTPRLLGNVDVLGDLLGMDLELAVAEHPVGGFPLDLLGCDVSDGSPVIVENQVEQSDHAHLGQILTYAAGTNPKTIVWINTGSMREDKCGSSRRASPEGAFGATRGPFWAGKQGPSGLEVAMSYGGGVSAAS